MQLIAVGENTSSGAREKHQSPFLLVV